MRQQMEKRRRTGGRLLKAGRVAQAEIGQRLGGFFAVKKESEE